MSLTVFTFSSLVAPFGAFRGITIAAADQRPGIQWPVQLIENAIQTRTLVRCDGAYAARIRANITKREKAAAKLDPISGSLTIPGAAGSAANIFFGAPALAGAPTLVLLATILTSSFLSRSAKVPVDVARWLVLESYQIKDLTNIAETIPSGFFREEVPWMTIHNTFAKLYRNSGIYSVTNNEPRLPLMEDFSRDWDLRRFAAHFIKGMDALTREDTTFSVREGNLQGLIQTYLKSGGLKKEQALRYAMAILAQDIRDLDQSGKLCAVEGQLWSKEMLLAEMIRLHGQSVP